MLDFENVQLIWLLSGMREECNFLKVSHNSKSDWNIMNSVCVDNLLKKKGPLKKNNVLVTSKSRCELMIRKLYWILHAETLSHAISTQDYITWLCPAGLRVDTSYDAGFDMSCLLYHVI